MMKGVVFVYRISLSRHDEARLRNGRGSFGFTLGAAFFFFSRYFSCCQYSSWRDGVSGQEFNMVQSCQISAEYDSCLL